MTSPFPGMDPWLEHPAFFPGLHDRLITYTSEMLQPRLPEPYYAEMSDRLWVEISERSIEPDVNILRRKDEPSASEEHGVGTAVSAAVGVEPVVVTVPHDEHREPFLQILARIGGEERIVTTVEVLSLSNKTRRHRGRRLYRKKQREILRSNINLVEVDLLRAGEHTTAVPRDHAIRKTGRFDYHVCVHRFDRFEEFLVYPIHLRDRLPEIVVPLLPRDGHVTLDLQAVFNRCYDAGPYARRLRYDEIEPVPPLSPEDAQWAAELLRQRKK